MAGLLNRLAPKGYPGQIFVCMLRYGYGTQGHLEKIEILHNWYSHLRAYLYEKFKKPEEIQPYSKLLTEANDEIMAVLESYNPLYEGDTCDPNEKEFIKGLWGVKERLDEITAKARIIDDLKADGEEFQV